MAVPLPAIGRPGSKAQLLQQDDQKRIGILDSRLSEQRKEIENKDSTIRSIQRNFEQLSTLCQLDKEQIQILQKRLSEAESKAVTEEEKRFAARYPQLKDAFDILNTKYVEAEAKLQKFQAQEKQDKEAKESSEALRKTLSAQLEALKKSAEDGKIKLAEALSSLNSSESKRAGLEKELKDIKDALKLEQKARIEQEKSDKAARADLARLQGQLLTMTDKAQAEAQCKDLRTRLAEAERRASELSDAAAAANAASRGSDRDARARLEKANAAAEAHQRQSQELHRLLESATAKAAALAAERDAARADARAGSDRAADLLRRGEADAQAAVARAVAATAERDAAREEAAALRAELDRVVADARSRQMQAQLADLRNRLDKREAHVARSDRIIQRLMADIEALRGGGGQSASAAQVECS